MNDQHLTWAEFERVELRAGTILEVEEFPEARKPAYRLRIDFGPELGVRRSSAQLTALYRPADLIGRQIVAVVNFAPKQIGPFRSECLVTGFVESPRDPADPAPAAVVLIGPDRPVQNGARLA